MVIAKTAPPAVKKTTKNTIKATYMKKAFITKIGLSSHNLLRLEQANEVVEIYAKQGYKLTLRQLYYQLVIQNIIPNKDTEYAKLSQLITKGRMAGVVDWDAIEDRIRQPRHTYSVESVEDAISDAEKHYRLDRMAGQANYIELWVEKDALSSVLSRKTNHYHIRLMVNRGYSSTSAMYDSHERFFKELLTGKKINLLYLGDHDPSGLDMDRDIFERIFLMLTSNPPKKWKEYCATLSDKELTALGKKYKKDELVYTDNKMDLYKAVIRDRFSVLRIGLTTKQVKQYDPPPNPAKITDPRAKDYIAKHGPTSWEVDALNPTILHSLIDSNILGLIDKAKFDAVIAEENEDKAELLELPEKVEKLSRIEDTLAGFKIPVPAKPAKGKKPVIKQTDYDSLVNLVKELQQA